MGEPGPSNPQTPLRNKTVQTPDTVVRSHHVSDAPYRTGDLSAGRDAVLRDLASIPEVPWDSFTQILPPSPLGPAQAQRVLDALKTDGIAGNKGWNMFTTDPSKNLSHEAEVFRPLDSLFDAIVTACKNELSSEDHLPCPYKWTTIANCSPKSARTSTSKPDAWLVLASTPHAQHVKDQNSYYWEDCCLSAQFKKGISSNDTNDVRARTDTIHSLCLHFLVHRIKR